MDTSRQKIKRCSRCILPETLSDIKFDVKGVCNHCLKYESSFKDWGQIQERKANEFAAIMEKARRLKRPYDCLVPLSGGKDSTFALYLATRIYGMKTLAITFDNGYLSNPAKDNIRNALYCSKADHIYYSMNRKTQLNCSEYLSRKRVTFVLVCVVLIIR